MQYASGDASKLMTFNPILNGLELLYKSSLCSKSNVAAMVYLFICLFIPRKWVMMVSISLPLFLCFYMC